MKKIPKDFESLLLLELNKFQEGLYCPEEKAPSWSSTSPP